ncbi:MAG: 3-oxoacyl-[acyl-carrier-protein] synthase III C-terminal domain-containing protein, partial [Pseudomonadota bacterium]
LHGVCASGMMAMKSAYLQIKVGEKQNAVACASEFPSRLFKSSRFESQDAVYEDGRLPFDTEFLRWMLSDGAGAVLMQDKPPANGLGLKVEWLTLKSLANRYDVCMYAGANKSRLGDLGDGWLDYPDFQQAAQQGAINLKQDIRLLDNIVKVGVENFFELVDEGRFQPNDIDHVLCHYSSHYFLEKITQLLEKSGVMIPREKWFSSLYDKGNTGSSSIYIMLDDLCHSGRLKVGDKILCMVPESGRFIVSFMLLTVESLPNQQAETVPAPKAPALQLNESDALQQRLVRQLARVWVEFESELNRIPLIDKLNRGRFTLDDYKLLLVNQRQQVIEGARWIARAASSLTMEWFPLRSLFISHAGDEHRDYQMLERNYTDIGGVLDDIVSAPKNIGSEALSAWIFHRAEKENPLDLLGAMFIIEGLGSRMANRWGEMIMKQLRLKREQVSFLMYHGENDENHFERLESALKSGLLTAERVADIVKTAKVTARLYRLQLEEIGNY